MLNEFKQITFNHLKHFVKCSNIDHNPVLTAESVL